MPRRGKHAWQDGENHTRSPDGWFARLAGVPVEQVVVVSAEAVTFPDGSLGCPQPGMVYTQALVDGYKIVAEAGGKTYDFRGTGSTFRLCTAT